MIKIAERKKRAVKRKNISLSEIEKRMMLQMNDEEKEKLADFVIENNNTEKQLFKKIETFYSKLF